MTDIINRLVVKPQLARRRQAINIPAAARQPVVKTVVVVTPRSAAKKRATASRHNIKASSERSDQAAPRIEHGDQQPALGPVAGRHGVQAVVQRPRSLRKQEHRKPKGVRFITPDVSSYEQEKIRNLRGRGAGKVLIIVGNGPSINEAPLELLRDHPYIDVMSINRPDSRLWPTAYWAFFDQSQMRRHNAIWESYNGIIFNSTSIKQSKNTSIKVKNLGGFGFSTDLMRGVHIGRSSVYAAMQIGLWLDFRHIYIFGCDMCEVDGKTHFYGDNPDAPRAVRLGRFDKEAEYYDNAGANLDEATRRRFTFCSAHNKYGFVEKFNRMDHHDAVPLILEVARNLFK